MPGGRKLVTFLSESWDHPDLIVPPVLEALREEKPEVSKGVGQDSGSEKTLEE